MIYATRIKSTPNGSKTRDGWILSDENGSVVGFHRGAWRGAVERVRDEFRTSPVETFLIYVSAPEFDRWDQGARF